MLKIQQLLRNQGFKLTQPMLDELEINYHFETGPDGNEYLHLDYSIKSPKTNEIVKECRGLALRSPDWSVFRFAFHRFMNYGEAGIDSFDFNGNTPLDFEEKLDGSLIIVSYLEGYGWIAGTRGKIFPTDSVQGFNFTFSELFWRTFDPSYTGSYSVVPLNATEKISKLQTKYFYVFEMCSLANRVVIKYEKPKIVLLTMRLNDESQDFIEASFSSLGEQTDFERPVVFEFKNLSECFTYIKNHSGQLQEGFVLRQWNKKLNRFSRMKIKFEEYVALHNIYSVRSLNNLVQLVLQEKRTSMENGFEEYLPAFDLINNALRTWCQDAEKFFQEHIGILESLDTFTDYKARRKNFAMEVVPTPYASFCFAKADNSDLTAWEALKMRDPKNIKSMKDLRVTSSRIKKIIEMFNLQSLVGKSWVIIEDEGEDI